MSKTDAGDEQPHDERVTAVETVRVKWWEFRHAVEYAVVTDTDRRRGGETVLRLSPPFEATMDATGYFSERGTRYPPEMDPKPLHVSVSQMLRAGDTDALNHAGEWPTRSNVRDALHAEDVDDDELDEYVDEARSMWWEELRHYRPSRFDLGANEFAPSHDVRIEWIDGGEER